MFYFKRTEELNKSFQVFPVVKKVYFYKWYSEHFKPSGKNDELPINKYGFHY